MINWPSAQLHRDFCNKGKGVIGCTCDADSVNVMREACITAYEEEIKEDK